MWDDFCEFIAILIRAPLIMSIENLFSDFSSQITELGALVSLTPAEYLDGSLFKMVETVQGAVLPIAVIILTLVMCYELISMIIDKNNMADFPVSDFLKWIFKTSIAIMFLDKSFDFVCAVFELAQHVVQGASSLVGEDLDFSFTEIVVNATENALNEKNWFWLVFDFLLVWLLRVVMIFAGLIINFTVALRMIEIHMMISLAPIPFATLGNKEFSQIGQSYIKSIFALAFQSFFMFLAIAFYGAILKGMVVTGGDVHLQICTAVGYSLFFCFTFSKVGSYSNRVFGV